MNSTKTLAVVVLAFILGSLSFVGGAFSVITESFPYRSFLHPAVEAAKAWTNRLKMADPITDTNLWLPSRYSKTGVVHHEPRRSWGTYTLYLSHTTEAYLIDKEGQRVHE